ncbi:17617_t:CDS:2, partial [Racocetra persica]
SVAVSINKDLVTRSAKPIANKTWVNWNGAVYISPNAIFEPSTLKDLIDIVKLAKTNNKTIRCAAQGHTESSLSVTKNYLVVVNKLNQITVKKLPKYGWVATAEADLIWVKNWVRTDESVSFTEQQIKQLRETQIQDYIKQYELLSSLLQNPEATPNITATIWKSVTSNGNTSSVLQAPDAIHYAFGEEYLKSEVIEIGFKVDPDFSNIVAELYHLIQKIYEFARKGKFPINRSVVFRFIKSSEALLSNTFNHDPKTLYCYLNFGSVFGTPGWNEFILFITQRFFDKYKAKLHWGKQWENAANVESYYSDLLSDQIKQFEKVREKYDPDKIFFDNKSLEDIFSRVLYS